MSIIHTNCRNEKRIKKFRNGGNYIRKKKRFLSSFIFSSLSNVTLQRWIAICIEIYWFCFRRLFFGRVAKHKKFLFYFCFCFLICTGSQEVSTSPLLPAAATYNPTLLFPFRLDTFSSILVLKNKMMLVEQQYWQLREKDNNNMMLATQHVEMEGIWCLLLLYCCCTFVLC